MNDHPLTSLEYATVFGKVPRACVDVVVTDPHKRVLLTKRTIEPYKGMWHLPGGGIVKGESILDAARRHVAKETGSTLIFPQIVGAHEMTAEPYEVDGNTFLMHSVVVMVTGRLHFDLLKAGHESVTPSWFAEMPSTNAMHPLQAEWLVAKGYLGWPTVSVA